MSTHWLFLLFHIILLPYNNLDDFISEHQRNKQDVLLKSRFAASWLSVLQKSVSSFLKCSSFTGSEVEATNWCFITIMKHQFAVTVSLRSVGVSCDKPSHWSGTVAGEGNGLLHRQHFPPRGPGCFCSALLQPPQWTCSRYGSTGKRWGCGRQHVCVVRCSFPSIGEGVKETDQREEDEALPSAVGDSLVGRVLASVLYLFCEAPPLNKCRGYLSFRPEILCSV